jgi:hypothetical protein
MTTREKDEIAAVIVKIHFGKESGVYPGSYLEELPDERAWNTPRKYKHLNGRGKRLLLYDGKRKSVTAEVEIGRVRKLKAATKYRWRNEFVRNSVRIFRPPIPVASLRKIDGFEEFGVYRKDRTPYRNVSQKQYAALMRGAGAAKVGVSVEQEAAESKGAYSSASEEEGRKKVWRSIALRRGQRKFRDRLLQIYDRRCCVTGTKTEEVLEAAHIKPYAESGTNLSRNGLLLRSDIHVLFDLFLISINPVTKSVFCSDQLRTVPLYARLHGKKVRFPRTTTEQPALALLREHYDQTTA